jgi:hypothetical protein
LTIALGSLIVTGAVALAALAAASDPAPAAATPVPDLPAAQEPILVDVEPVCTGQEQCTVTSETIEFRRQKPNGKCVYVCTQTTECTDPNGAPFRSCCPLECQDPVVDIDRMRIGPFPPGACPPATPDICDFGEPIPPGEPD